MYLVALTPFLLDACETPVANPHDSFQTVWGRARSPALEISADRRRRRTRTGPFGNRSRRDRDRQSGRIVIRHVDRIRAVGVRSRTGRNCHGLNPIDDRVVHRIGSHGR